jgi:hypothetical protein
MPASRLEGLGRRRQCVQLVPLAAVALPAAELPPGPAPVERSAGAAPQSVQVLGSAHSVRARPGSARCGPARREVARFEVSLPVVGGQ